MLVITAKKEIERINEEVTKLLVRKAELQLYVDQMDAYMDRIVEETAKQMRDWHEKFKKENL